MYFWIDSKVVFSYINNDSRCFYTFVENRVQKICNSTAPNQWHCVSTNRNLADRASWGRTVKELLGSDWHSGPLFLWESEMPSPEDFIPDLGIRDPEI